MKRKIFVALALVAGAIGLLTALFYYPYLRSQIQRVDFSRVDVLAEHLRSFGLWTPIISLGLMILQSAVAPIPGWIVTAANGIVFGVPLGFLLSWVGAMLGATLNFAISRYIARKLVLRVIKPSFQDKIDQLNGRRAFAFVLVMRLIPGISFDLISYLAGLSRIRLLPFLAASGIGVTPTMMAYTIFAHDLVRARALGLRFTIFLLIMVLLYLAGIYGPALWNRISFGRYGGGRH